MCQKTQKTSQTSQSNEQSLTAHPYPPLNPSDHPLMDKLDHQPPEIRCVHNHWWHQWTYQTTATHSNNKPTPWPTTEPNRSSLHNHITLKTPHFVPLQLEPPFLNDNITRRPRIDLGPNLVKLWRKGWFWERKCAWQILSMGTHAFKYVYAYMEHAHAYRVLEYLQGKFLDINLHKVNLISSGSHLTPLYDHHKQVLLALLKHVEFTRKQWTK